jgi:hypothetical protein
LRFGHFLLAGLLLGATMPFGLLFLQMQIDPRIRVAGQITDRQKPRVLVSVPYLWTPTEQRAALREMEWLGLVVSGMLILVALTAVLRMVKVV